MKSVLAYVAAAFLEIGGCFAVWAWLRLGASAWWLLPGALALGLFAWLLTLIDVDAAGRAYAAYGGIYIAATLVWLWLVEGTRPDRWDLIGVSVCLVGAAIILLAPHRTRDESCSRRARRVAFVVKPRCADSSAHGPDVART